MALLDNDELATFAYGLLSGKGGFANNLGQAGLLSLETKSKRKREEEQQKQQALQNQMLQMQLSQAQQSQQQEQARQQAFKTLPNFNDPRQGMQSLAPTQENAADLATKKPPSQYDRALQMAQYLESKGLVKDAQTYYQQAEKFMPKFKEENRVVMKDGQPVLRQFGQGGESRDVADALPYEKPIEANLGGSLGYLDPFTLKPRANLGKSVSPDAQLGANTTMRGQNLTNARALDLNEIQRQGQRTQILDTPAGPIAVDKGTAQARPVTMGGQAVKGEAIMKKEQGATRVLALLDQAEKVLPNATNSYAGAGVDLAARMVGGAPQGAQAIGQLKAIEGALLSEMPRMEGPQSNYDVQNYKQAAGQLGDPTVPNEIKMAAIETIKEIHQRYAGKQQNRPQFSIPSVQDIQAELARRQRP